MLRRRIALLSCGACALAVLAGPLRATAGDRNEGALWLVNQAAVPFDERFSFHAMVQNRWVDDVGDYERTVIRPWFGFAPVQGLQLDLGYDRHEFDQGSDENRIWQRIAYQHDFGESALFGHFWLEERFFEGTTRIAWRGRFQVGGTMDLPADLGALVRNEFFVDLNETSRIRQRGLGENHLYAGLYYPLSSWLRVDAGYLMQYRDQNDRDDLFDHTFFFGFSVRTPQLFGEPPSRRRDERAPVKP